ncbi:hypothetical protein ABBQ32_001385 [Trebouxia sp. C0010 RCD-2024]
MQKVRVVDTCVIRAVSLEYEYTCNSGDFGNDAILSTCDSFVCGGQVEPTAETDNIVAMDYKALARGQEPLLKVALIQLAEQGSILSVTLAHCVADGSGFTRILQSLALMCSNQPGLPMRFGADHLYPPPPYTLRAPGTDVQQQQEVDESGLGKDLKQQSARMVMAGLDSHAQHALMQGHLHQAQRVFQPETGIGKRLKLAWQLLPGLISDVIGRKCKQVLHIPAPLLHALKAELQGQVHQQRLSCNDVLSALLWHVACDIRGRPRPWQGCKRGQGCLAYPLNLRALHVPPHYCGNALLLNLLAGGSTARSEGKTRRHSTTVPFPQAAAVPPEKQPTATDREHSLHKLAFCAGRISAHTAEAKQAFTVTAALSLLHASADASPLAKRLTLCLLGVDVDLWVSNWSNLYQLDDMQIDNATPDLFLGHSIGPQLGTAAVILQPDKSCYHVDWYIPGRLASKLMRHNYWESLLPGSTWL